MADITINGLAAYAAPLAGDFIGVWDAAAGQYKKSTRTQLIGATITGGGTLATGGNALTVPASGTAALVGINNAFPVGQTINGIDIGATGNDGFSRPGSGKMLLKMGSNFTLAGLAPDGTDIGLANGMTFVICYVAGTAFMAGIVQWDLVTATIVSGGTWFVSASGAANKINFYVGASRAYIRNMYSSAAEVNLLHFSTST